MRWRHDSFPCIVCKKQKWHKWFAWFPVRVSEDEIVWLVCVERRSGFKSEWDYFDGWEWEYRTIQEK